MLLYSQIGKSKESIKSSLENIENDSTSVIEWRCLIQAYMFDNDLDNAYKCFAKAIKKFKNDAIILTLGGDICKQLGKHEEALSYWNKAVEIDPSCLEVKYSKINYYAQIGNITKCKDIVAEVVDELKKKGLDVEATSEEKRLNNLINDSRAL